MKRLIYKYYERFGFRLWFYVIVFAFVVPTGGWFFYVTVQNTTHPVLAWTFGSISGIAIIAVTVVTLIRISDVPPVKTQPEIPTKLVDETNPQPSAGDYLHAVARESASRAAIARGAQAYGPASRTIL